jgi:hypothetical protein
LTIKLQFGVGIVDLRHEKHLMALGDHFIAHINDEALGSTR